MSRISFPRSARGISTAFNLSAGLLLLVLMVLTVVDVLGRSMFGQSVLGTVDISTLLLVAIAFLGLASAEIDGRHVSVTLLEGRFGFRTRMVFSGVRAVLLLGVGAVVVWGLGDVMLSAFERGETTNDILRLATWPAKLVLFASFLLFFVMAVWKEILEFRAFRAGEVPESSEVDAAVEQAYSATHTTHERESEGVQ